MPPAVEAHALSRSFGHRRAVDRVDLTIGAGDAVAMFGPNGAGKTTLLRLVAGLLRPTSGSVSIGGSPVRGDSAARASVGYISHHTMLYDALTPRENVELAARLYGVPDVRGSALAALESLKIADRADGPVRALSRGMQQRVSIARAIVHRPTVVLLDEPYTGLDTIGASALTTMLLALRTSGAALVLVTHNVVEGLALATHAAVMLDGRVARIEATSGVDAARYAGEYQALVAAPQPNVERVA